MGRNSRLQEHCYHDSGMVFGILFKTFGFFDDYPKRTQINLNNDQDLSIFINSLRNLYEDTWKRLNEINTSIKLSIVVKTENDNLNKSTRFELDLNDIELVNDYSIQKFNKKFIFYEILFNGTVQNFINIMENKNYNLNTQKKIWILE